MVEATVVEATVEEGGDVSEVVACSVAVVLGVKAVVVVDLWVVVDAVVPRMGAVVIVAVVVAVDVVKGSDGVAPTVVGVVVVLFNRVTYEKGVGVGGRDTPSGYG